MAERNEDKMKAKVPFWFQQILGWESRILVRRWKLLVLDLVACTTPAAAISIQWQPGDDVCMSDSCRR